MSADKMIMDMQIPFRMTKKMMDDGGASRVSAMLTIGDKLIEALNSGLTVHVSWYDEEKEEEEHD